MAIPAARHAAAVRRRRVRDPAQRRRLARERRRQADVGAEPAQLAGTASTSSITRASPSTTTCASTTARSPPSTTASAASSRWLDDSGLADNTTVIFTSDNGYMEGEHGLIDKRNAYEESMRIPLVMSAPGLIAPGTVVESSVTTPRLRADLPRLRWRRVTAAVRGSQHPPARHRRALARPVERGRRLRVLLGVELPADADDLRHPHAASSSTSSTTASGTPRSSTTSSPIRKEMHNLIDDDRYFDVKVDLRRRLYEGLADNSGQPPHPLQRPHQRRHRLPATATPHHPPRSPTTGTAPPTTPT